MPQTFVAVLGATASGKSSLAMRIAKEYGGEIVSCDSMQIYRGMDVGTAKPSASDMQTVRHHLIDIASPDDSFSAGDFAEAAKSAIRDIFSRGALPVVCGGTFLYLDTLTEVSSLSAASRDDALREELSAFARESGAAALHGMLEEIDPESAAAIHPNNVKRVIRAIEIYRTTGKTKSEWDALSKKNEPPFSALRIVIDFADRSILYGRIDRRVDAMMESGLEDEARRLYDGGYLSDDRIASQAIGYKEFIGYFEGNESLDDAVFRIKQSSRNYAKRQLTWLKRYSDAAIIRGDDNGRERTPDEMFEDAKAILVSRGLI